MLWRQREPSLDVVVMTSGDRAALALARSLLESAQIPYVVTSDCVEDLFGWGRLGAAYNFITGPAKVLVNQNDEQAAREILGEIEQPASPTRPLWLLALVWIAVTFAAVEMGYALIGMISGLLLHVRLH